ncbi:TlpA family protein disulfide reductase [Dyadobacter tibetensis]|uniref:TlpA family protein disulfide reductase n=1 Tax=Dyadobacter tibetensis TaxID=1211851 RepID=UPI0010395DC1|nr:thioredoxin-like domain-containing protein [Dyadobacter tibetensis]
MRIKLFWLFFVLTGPVLVAQDIKEYKGKITQQYSLNASTVIINEQNRKPLSLAQYDRLNKDSPGTYRLVPQFNRFGKVDHFLMVNRKGEAGSFILFEEDLMPEVGEELPAFEMLGLDGKVYKSESLRGQYILLGFWVRFEKPLYTLASTRVISDFIGEQARKGVHVVSLGTTLNTREECLKAIPKRNCGFVPVPQSYGFNHRYHIGETPYFILIDKHGKVLARAAHTEFEKIAEVKLK